MALLDGLNQLKIEEPIVVKKGDKKIPLSEIPIGTTIKVGVLSEGKWVNKILPLTDALTTLLIDSKKEGETFSLEIK